ncbi:MAG: hypothetical protein HC770_12625 [Pseudanabaena sp. CRU_2_10]|nr:hypothetical protein [Pseudanabaena sp. CRU_2_10]
MISFANILAMPSIKENWQERSLFLSLYQPEITNFTYKKVTIQLSL